MESKETKEQQTKLKIHPRKRTNVISRLFFCWSFPIFLKGLKKDLSEDDLYKPLRSHESKPLGDNLELEWAKEVKTHKSPSLWRVLFKVHGKRTFLYGLVSLVQELVVKMAHPTLIGGLLAFYKPGQSEITKNQAYLYASGIILVSLVNIIIQHSYFLGMQQLGLRIRVSCSSLIYRKALKLSREALAESTVGQMVNLLANDVNRFDRVVLQIHHLVIGILETFIVMYLLYATVSPTAMAGMGLLLTFIPLQMYIGRRVAHFRRKTAQRTDQRVRLMNEIITGIQVIKMYTWEKPFAKLVELARLTEVNQIRATSYLRAATVSFSMFVNRTAVFFCILAYILTGNTLQAEYVYVVTSYYGILRQALTQYLPRGVITIAETQISVSRIQNFMKYDELKPSDESPRKADTQEVKMEGISLKYNNDNNILVDIDFEVKPKQLVAIVGPVGCGKTTLLHVILKEIRPDSGMLITNGRVSYASQEPWIFAASIRQNILFGLEMDQERYDEVIRVCALDRDLSLLPYGDRTLVGERGVMLSGGQKARISLARAVYKQADIYLLDDPLSAVDAHVGKQLFNQCILTYLQEKSVVLVTHQLHHLTGVHQIYVMEQGRITQSGSYSDLRSSGSGEFVKLLEEEQKHEFMRSMSEDKAETETKPEKKENPAEMLERRTTGSLSRQVYFEYFKTGGVARFCSTLVLFLLAQIVGSGSELFINFWVNLEQKRYEDSLLEPNIEEHFDNSSSPVEATTPEDDFFTAHNCIYIYSALIVVLIVLALGRSLSFFAVCMRSSMNLHNKMFAKIVSATMRFFNTNPSGRILNRFAKDMGAIDETLPSTIIDSLQVLLNALAITMVLSSVNPWIIIPTIVIFVIFYCYKTIFLATSRNLKRIEGRSRSPVFSHLTASLQGLTTIRAFSAQSILKGEFDHYQDVHSSAFFLYIGCSRAFAFWLDTNCVVYIGIVIMSFLFIGTETYGGNVGLAITQAISLTGTLQFGMRQWSDLENQMTSVERVVEYIEMDGETVEGDTPSEKWPSKGKIEFDNLSLKYSPDGPPVLKNLSFTIEPRQKIGIVGRTGAGKSSLISALFRLAHIEGTIVIDKIDVQKITLNSLRSKISIIPQEPVLFSGTLRKNLDPFEQHQDEELWTVLEQVNLKSHVFDLPGALSSKVYEGGSNFRVGQRQLLCLARAILRKNKILILDEATANVDPQTDELIQSTIRRKFEECTVLTIAHRLNTVMDSDKILVMDEGRAVEFGWPSELLLNDKGHFKRLVRQSGMLERFLKISQHDT